MGQEGSGVRFDIRTTGIPASTVRSKFVGYVVDARDEDAHTDDARDEIARVAAHDVRHMLSRSGLHEIVELARSVTENNPAHETSGRRSSGAQQGPASRQGPGGPNGSVAPHGSSRYPMRGE